MPTVLHQTVAMIVCKPLLVNLVYSAGDAERFHAMVFECFGDKFEVLRKAGLCSSLEMTVEVKVVATVVLEA